MQLPVAHAHTQGNPEGSRELWSLSVALVLVLPYYIVYYYSKKKMRGNGCAFGEHTFVTSGSGHVTSGSTTRQHHPKYVLSCTDILLFLIIRANGPMANV